VVRSGVPAKTKKCVGRGKIVDGYRNYERGGRGH